MSARHLGTALLLGLASCAPPAPPPAAPPAPPAPVAPPPPAAAVAPEGSLRAVFHLSDAGRASNARGLTNALNALNALKALGDEPARLVVVVHGPALEWFRRGEPENLGAPLAALLATGKVELRVCAKTMEENRWLLGDLLPGAKVVPSGTLEVLRLERAGYVYFRP